MTQFIDYHIYTGYNCHFCSKNNSEWIIIIIALKNRIE